MAKAPRIYWDTCAWLGFLNGEPDKKRELEIVYEKARKTKYELWTSALSVVETRRLKSEEQLPKPLDKATGEIIRDLFRQRFVFVVPLTLVISEELRDIFRATPKLGKWQDSVHLATALAWDADVLHTYDHDDLLHLSMKLTCKNGELLPICYPDETTDGPLFAHAKK